MRPHILILEGVDYTGKSTNALAIKKQLDKRQHKSIIVRAPGGSPLGEKMRDIARIEATSLDEQFLAYTLALVASKAYIERLVSEGYTVILDRWTESLFAYQILKERHLKKQMAMSDIASHMLSFDKTFRVRATILSITTETLEQRRNATKTLKDASDTEDRFDVEGRDYRAGIVAAYETLTAIIEDSDSAIDFLAIDANRDPETVTKDVLDFFLTSF